MMMAASEMKEKNESFLAAKGGEVYRPDQKKPGNLNKHKILRPRKPV